MKIILTSFMICLLVSCAFNYESKESACYKQESLVHSVILKVKDETTQEEKKEILSSLKSLGKIEETNALFVAQKADMNDPRAKLDYDFILQMSFENEENLKKYSADPFHLEVRESLKSYLSSAPVVYDYWVK